MKKRIIFTVWMALALVLTITRPVSADVIFPNTHHVDWNVKFVNLDKFPEIGLVAQGTRRVTGWPDYEYNVVNNEPLYKQYHIDTITVYWNTKDRLNSPKYIDAGKSLEVVEPHGGFDYGYVPDSNPLLKKTIEYSLAGFNGTKLMFYQSRTVSEYYDGTPVKDETFDNPWAGLGLSTTPPPQPVPFEIPVTPPTATPPIVIEPDVIVPTPATTVNPPRIIVDINQPQNALPPPSLSYEQKFLLGLLLTLAVEIPAAILLVRFVFKRRDISISKITLVGIVASGLTLPYLWFVLPSFISNSTLYLIFGELSVFLVETLIYIWLLQLRAGQALAVSLIANAASMLIGFVLL